MAVARPASNALSFLEAEHARALASIAALEAEVDPVARLERAKRLCGELTIHASMEELVLYPAVRAELGDGEEALARAEHGRENLKVIVAGIVASSPNDERLEARLSALAESVRAHVEDEEVHLFPLLEASRIDLDVLEQELEETKTELEATARSIAEPPAAPPVAVPLLHARRRHGAANARERHARR